MKNYLIIIFTIFLISCNSENKDNQLSTKDSLIVITPQEQHIMDSVRKSNELIELINSYDIYPKIHYTQIILKTKSIKDSIYSIYGYSKKNLKRNKVFITLNRKESRYIRVGDTVIVPDTIISDKRAYSIFPQYFPKASHLNRLILVSNYYQCWAAFENGKQVYFAAANTGKERTPTYPGRYALVFKQKTRLSSTDSSWRMNYYYNFHPYAGMAFHEYEMPGYPASHACVRQFRSDAKWLYNWGKGVKVKDKKTVFLSGTPVVILGVPNYDRKRGGPWVDLISNKDSLLKLDFDPMQIEEARIPLSQIFADAQDWVPNRKYYLHSEDTLRARGVIREHVKLIESVNINKLKREKKAKALKDSINKINTIKKELIPQNDKNKTDLETIKQNLELLEQKKIKLKINKDSSEKR
ncbi:L,D-transpeptidase [Candidatus Kapabacteria bacterium]|nr:L,D-transpeptidase [Candidatus Kapabacteria bacterium]